MSHNDNILPYGLWPVPIVPTPKRLSALDDAIAKMLNADDGGAWNPTTPIIIGGAGMNLTTASSQILGGVTTKSGGKLVLGNNDWPTFSATRSRRLTMPILPQVINCSALNGIDADVSPTYGCLRSLTLSGSKIIVPIPKRFMHNGATLATATLAWRVGQPHGIVPVPTPTLGLYRITTAGVSTALNSTPTVSVVAATADAYYNKGNAQTLLYTTNQNNVVDPATYTYAFVWTEEAGAIPNNGPPLNLLHSLSLAYTTISDQRFE